MSDHGEAARVGFIGLGIMGSHLAANLLDAGYDLVVHDINEEAMAELTEQGAAAGDSPADVASQVDVVITYILVLSLMYLVVDVAFRALQRRALAWR